MNNKPSSYLVYSICPNFIVTAARAPPWDGHNNIDAMVYTYPGAPIPRLVGRLRHIINQDNSNIVLQCGGNALEIASPAAVVREYDHLISEVRQLAPNAHIYISAIPPRKGRAHILEDIAKVNTYLSNRGRRGDDVTCIHVCPTDLHHFSRDKCTVMIVGEKSMEWQWPLCSSEIFTWCKTNH